MPITQERMIAVINAGVDCMQGLDKLSSLIATETKLVHNGQQTAEQALEHLSHSANPAWLLSKPVETKVTLLSEHNYFRRNAGRNRANARWQAGKRAKGRGEEGGKSVPLMELTVFDQISSEASKPDEISFEEAATGMNFEEELRKTEEYARLHPRPKPSGG